MEEKSFELVPVIDPTTGRYVIKDFDKAYALVNEFVDTQVNAVREINDDLALKQVKAIRTDIRKKKDLITQTRLHINALTLGDINAQFKMLEDKLSEGDKIEKDKIDAYKPKADRPTLTTLVVKGYDLKAIEQVKDLALKLGLYAEEK